MKRNPQVTLDDYCAMELALGLLQHANVKKARRAGTVRCYIAAAIESLSPLTRKTRSASESVASNALKRKGA